MRNMARFMLGIGAAALWAGCGGSQVLMEPGRSLPQSAATHPRGEVLAIQHVIVIVQNNRTFDNLFAGYPHADAPTKGLESTGKRVRLREISLKHAPCEGIDHFQVAYDGGKMDGWNLINPKDPLCPYTRVNRSEVQSYWNFATHYAIADHMFESTHWGDFTNQLYQIAGTTKLASRTFDVLYPSNIPWTCAAPPGTTTSLLKGGKVHYQKGPLPCFTQFPTVANLLDAAHVTWKCYFGSKGDPLNACPFSAINYVFEGSDSMDLSEPASNILKDLKNENLADVSWVFSPPKDSDSPESSGGPKWVSSIITATKKSTYWAHSAIIVVWNDAYDGNFYDDVPPSQLSEMGLGFRVPLLVVSPYAKRGYVSHTDYQFGSILKFIEQNWRLGSLDATDKQSHSIADMFEFKE